MTPSSDARAIGEDVAANLREYGLPFFDRVRTPAQLEEWLRGDGHGALDAQTALILATLAVERGDLPEAHALLTVAVAERRGEPFESTIRSVAGRLGVSRDA